MLSVFRRTDKEKIALLLLFSILTFVQLWVARSLQFVPVADAGSIFSGAVGLATTGELPNPEYFARFGNQWGLLIFISAFFWVGQVFTQNFFMIYAGVLTLLINIGLYALYDLVKTRFNKRVAFIILAIVLLFPKIYFFPSKIYTDAASVAMPIIALNLFYRMRAEESKKWVLFAVLTGVVLALGAAFKPTVAIMFIAMGMLSWIYKAHVRLYKGLLIAGIVMAILLSANMLSRNLALGDEMLERHQAPWFQWFVMGLKEEDLENNMWIGTNTEPFYSRTVHMEVRAEREAFIRSELVRLVDEKETMGDWARLFVKKYIVLHYRGDFAPGCTIVFSEDDSGLKAWFGDIRFSAPYVAYNRVILYSIIFLAYISIFFKRRDWVASLALFGVYFFFVFLSEVSPRQLSNYLFIFFYLSSISIDGILRKLGWNGQQNVREPL